MKSYDVIAIGSLYVDINASDYPFQPAGIPNETELIGGDYDVVAGGSAVNFCRLLGRFGMRPAFIGVAGTDAMGDMAETLLEQAGVTPKIVRKPDVKTNIGFNMTSPEGEHIMCVAGTANASLSPEDVLPVLEEIAHEAESFYFGGSFKLTSFMDSFGEIVSIAKTHDVDLYVDHGRVPQNVSDDMKHAVQNLVHGASYYLASREEFLQLWAVDTLERGVQKLYESAPHLQVVIKDGKNGAYFSENGALRHVAAPEVTQVKNLTGAGDSFNAGFMAAITKGLDTDDAVSYGCAVAASKIANQSLPTLT